jgi:hypothetical protein
MNQPNQPPKTKKPPGLVIDYSFDETRLPIFWGPNQVIKEDGVYQKPTGWKDFKPLTVPNIVRFLYDGFEPVAHEVECNNPITRALGSEGSSESVTGTYVGAWSQNWSFFYGFSITPQPKFKGEQWRIVRTFDSTISPGQIVEAGSIDSDGRFIGLDVDIFFGNQIINFDSLHFDFSTTHAGPPSKIAYCMQYSCDGVFHPIPSNSSEYNQGVHVP